ncbi:MAG: SRPBCC family protein [Jiangellales bacterium]
MTTTTYKRSIHIDAPVETVFDHVEDPRNFYAALAALSPEDPPKLTDVDTKPEGVGSTYQWTFHLWSLLYIGGTMTREEYVPNERIVDHSSTGPVWTFAFEPDPDGTTLSLAMELSTRVPLLDKLEAAVLSKGDQDLDAILDSFKKAIET